MTLGNSGAIVQGGLNTTIYTAQADANGNFSLPGAVDPVGVIIVHDQGQAQVSPAELARAGAVRLQPWAGIQGRLILDGQPVANATVVAYNQILRHTAAGRPYNFLNYRFEATTGANGEFFFTRVSPGDCSVFVQVQASRYVYSSYGKMVEVSSGNVTAVQLGGAGRPVVGKLVGPPAAAAVDWTKVPVSLRPKIAGRPASPPKPADFPTDAAFTAASESYWELARKDSTYVALCNNDGTFRIPDVPAGAYQLKIDAHDFKQNSATPGKVTSLDSEELIGSLDLQVEISDGAAASPVDLGTLELAPAPKPATAPGN